MLKSFFWHYHLASVLFHVMHFVMHNKEFNLNMYNLTHTHTPAEGGVISQDSDVRPRGGVPVGEIVPLLWALVTIAIAIGVLTGVDGSTNTEPVVLLQFLVCSEQALKRRRINKFDIGLKKTLILEVLTFHNLINNQLATHSLPLLTEHQF